MNTDRSPQCLITAPSRDAPPLAPADINGQLSGDLSIWWLTSHILNKHSSICVVITSLLKRAQPQRGGYKPITMLMKLPNSPTRTTPQINILGARCCKRFFVFQSCLMRSTDTRKECVYRPNGVTVAIKQHT